MNTYQLDDKAMDREFLAGKTVTCKAVVRKADSDSLKSGARIVVSLSNGKKYMGEIVNFTCQVLDDYASGILEIVRLGRS